VLGKSASEIFGSPDDIKHWSCATLFAQMAPATPVFDRLIEVYFQGQPDGKSLRLLGEAGNQDCTKAPTVEGQEEKLQ
jgi:uncharacterized protein (DUF1810 family)